VLAQYGDEAAERRAERDAQAAAEAEAEAEANALADAEVDDGFFPELDGTGRVDDAALVEEERALDSAREALLPNSSIIYSHQISANTTVNGVRIESQYNLGIRQGFNAVNGPSDSLINLWDTIHFDLRILPITTRQPFIHLNFISTLQDATALVSGRHGGPYGGQWVEFVPPNAVTGAPGVATRLLIASVVDATRVHYPAVQTFQFYGAVPWRMWRFQSIDAFRSVYPVGELRALFLREVSEYVLTDVKEAIAAGFTIVDVNGEESTLGDGYTLETELESIADVYFEAFRDDGRVPYESGSNGMNSTRVVGNFVALQGDVGVSTATSRTVPYSEAIVPRREEPSLITEI
jgi:hypothetical protein